MTNPDMYCKLATVLNADKKSVKYEDIEQTLLCINILIQDSVQKLSLSLPPTISSSEPTMKRSKEDKVPTILTEIECVFLIKQRSKYIDNFLFSHLFQIVKQTNTYE